VRLLYSILYIAAAVCFLFAAFGANLWGTAAAADGTTRTVRFGVNLVALGLFFWVLVPTIILLKA
jgi:hypothetical protein